MRGPEDRRRAATEVTPQELGLIAKVARAFRTTDRDELQADLARRLLDLKRKPRSHIRDWNAYLAKFLYNKASTWVQTQRRLERRVRSLDESDPENTDEPIAEPRDSADTDSSQSLAFATVWADLGPELQQFWTVLIEEGGNQSKAADRLGIHRNTARKRRARIVEVLKAHGFNAP
jgi:DNA-directed RNA polymerase specialized sigma24 family protein